MHQTTIDVTVRTSIFLLAVSAFTGAVPAAASMHERPAVPTSANLERVAIADHATPDSTPPSDNQHAHLRVLLRNSRTGVAVLGRIVSSDANDTRSVEKADTAGLLSLEQPPGSRSVEASASGYRSLVTRFKLQADSELRTTIWLDPIDLPKQLQPDSLHLRVPPGMVMVHGYIVDAETALPLNDVGVYLARSGSRVRSNADGYFWLLAHAEPTPASSGVPETDDLVVAAEGFRHYTLTNVLLTEGATHVIIELQKGSGSTTRDGTHKLLMTTMATTEVPEPPVTDAVDSLLSTAGSAGVTPESVSIPNSIRVGFNCPSSISCTNVQVYSLETYVANGLDDEWIPSWTAESLKAGAVAYRSYGVWHVSHPKTANYDICSTTACQVNDPGDTTASVQNAAAATVGVIVVNSTSSGPYFAEYSAHNNNLCSGGTCSGGGHTWVSCGDGYSGRPPTWPCLYDSVETGYSLAGHGGGMSQWGSYRWDQQDKDWQWIVNHYYNANGIPSGSRNGVLQFDHAAPAVTLIAKQVSTTSVTVGQPFSVSTTIRVDSATAEHAGISLSFPSLTVPGTNGSSYSSAQGAVSTTSASGATQYYIDNYPSHLLAEADWSNVTAGATKSFNITVTPKQTGAFLVRIRGWVTTSGYSNAWRDPSSGTLDQQGYPIYEYTVNVAGSATRIIRLAGDLAFGNVAVGGTATRTLTIYNDGNATLNVSGISYPSGFTGTWAGSIAAGGSKVVSVTFAPSSAITYGGTITVNSDKTSGGNTISCSGSGVSSSTRIIRLAGDLSFGSVTVGQTGTRQLTIHNDGNAILTVSSISYASGFAGDWSGGAISAGSSRVVNVTFAPTAGTTYSGTITVNSDKTSGLNSASCSGTGTVASQAVYDSVLKVPKCASVGSTCDSGSLLMGRAGLGPEPNAPNTLANSCSDGASGVYQSDESNERLSISSTDGTPFAPGKTVRIEATVWAYDSSDVLDLYYTTDIQNPSWLWIATFGIGASGSQTLSTIYTIPSGSALHAVRASFRFQGSPSFCTGGPYDDHDDLVFAVNNTVPGPQTLNVNRSGSGTVTSNTGGIDCGSTCSATFAYNSQVTLTASAATGWTFSSWSGACNGTATQCVVTMSQARTVTATFSSTASPEPHGFIEVTGATAQVHDLAVGPDGSIYVLYGTTDPKTLHIVKSTDGAKTWQSPTSLPNSTYTNSNFQLAVDPAGVLHVVWYVSSDDQVYYARSTNGGVSFAAAVGVRTGSLYDGYRTENGVEPAVGSDGAGNVYVAYGAYTMNSSGTFLGYNVWVSRSTNGGSSFAPEFPINAISSTQKKPRRVRATAAYLYVLFMDETNDNLYCHRRAVGGSSGTTGRVNGTPGEVQYGGDLVVGAHDAILYAVFSDTTNDSEGNITFTKSTDGGVSWSGAVTVNDSTNRQQYHPMLSIDTVGRVHAAWTDGRSNGRTQAYYAYSDNGGTSFSSNVNVSAPMTDVRFTQTHLVSHDASSSVYISATREITQVMVARLSATPPQQQPPTAPAGLTATATSSARVELTWAAVSDADQYQIERKSAGGSFTQIATTAFTTYADTSAAANTAYLYRVRASNEAGPSPNSAADLAVTIVFTNANLLGRTVQSIDIAQLRAAVNALRALAGLPTTTFSYSATAGTLIRAQDVTELRTNTDEARSALGLPVIAYLDSTLSGQTIKAVHIEQLRERFR